MEESLRPVPASAAPNLQEWVAEVPLAYPEKEVDPADAAAQGEGGAAAAAADDSDDSGAFDIRSSVGLKSSDTEAERCAWQVQTRRMRSLRASSSTS
eukprot:COSAG04_NODE_7294_length_1152_cov_1.197531_3_plen_97_part_00